MNKLKWILPLFTVCIVLTGCPYESEVPLDKPTIKINPALLGKWNPQNSPDELYVVSKRDDYTYKIKTKSDGMFTSELYSAYLSNLGGDTFLNVLDEDSASGGKYIFYKMELNKAGNQLTLWSVSDSLTKKFDISADLKAYFLKNKESALFYENERAVFMKNKE